MIAAASQHPDVSPSRALRRPPPTTEPAADGPGPGRQPSAATLRLALSMKVAQLRRKQGLSLQALSDQSGLAISYLNEIERGKKFPKPDKVLALARALGVEYHKLVSPDLGEKLQPLAAALKSGLIEQLPLEVLGTSPAQLMQLAGGDPEALSGMLDLGAKIAQRFDLNLDDLLRASVLSYLEQHKHFFGRLETEAAALAAACKLGRDGPPSLAALGGVLRRRWRCVVDTNAFAATPDLAGLRSVTIEGTKPRLLVNGQLHPREQAFQLAREIGYRHLGLEPRPRTAPVLRAESYRHQVHEAEASYFAGALLLQRESFSAGLHAFFASPRVDPEAFLRLLASQGASPEMFMHRMSQLMLPEFGVEPQFYVRIDQPMDGAEVRVEKEIHYQPMRGIYSIELDEHYCRRWTSVRTLLAYTAACRGRTRPAPRVAVARSRMLGRAEEMLLLAIAYARDVPAEVNSCVIVGFDLTDALRRTLRFWNDPAIPSFDEGFTCERCPLTDCADRVAPPILERQISQRARQIAAVEALQAAQREDS